MTDETLDQIRARDAELHYCTCGTKVELPMLKGDPHLVTVEQCEAILAKGDRPPAPAEDIERYGYGPRGLCWNAADHHPFVEGEPYDQTEIDRRWLLRYIDHDEKAYFHEYAPDEPTLVERVADEMGRTA